MNTELIKDFVVYFEFYGRKMKTTVSAKNETEAKQIILDRVNFIRVDESVPEMADSIFNQELNDTFDRLMDILITKKKKYDE